ncbi:BIM1 Protein BIM1 [Candida maltosa Xu316]
MVVGESRAELLNWLNTTLDLNYTKIEQCGSGAAFCQLMDTIVGDVPLNKVKYNAKTEYEYRHNYKILQHVFVKNNITKSIDVEKLIRCKLQDNLELLQWIKRYASSNNYPMKTTITKPQGKQPSPKNRSSMGTINNNGNSVPPGVAPKVRDRRSNTPIGSRKSSGVGPTTVTPTRNGRGNGRSPNGTNGTHHQQQQHYPQSNNNSFTEDQSSATQQGGAITGVTDTSMVVEEYAMEAQQMQSERNFYFNKLRAIEILVQHAKEMDGLSSDLLQFANEIEKIMYEEYIEEEEDEF